ncbi:MAG: glycosyltransferase [Pirellulales bacterium]|nr:glycosyltransferase [Planctomycetales bacterium]
MRVVLNTYPVAFDCPGGGEVQLLQSRAALQRRGVQVDLFDVWKPQLRTADVVHYFSLQGGSANFCCHVKNIGRPLAISPIVWLTDENVPRFPVDEMRHLLHLCDRVLPNSLAERDQLVEFFGISPAKCTVTHNGVDETFAELADADVFRERFDVHGPFVLCVANIEPRKNQLRLIEAIRSLDVELVLVGHVRDEAYYHACLDRAGDNVRHVGPLSRDDALLRSAYRACEVFALPSELETPGLAALEAATQGAKIVITGVGATREYFADFVEYVAPSDTAAIATAIDRALSATPNATLRQHVLTRFSWDRTAEQLIEAYETMLAAAASV